MSDSVRYNTRGRSHTSPRTGHRCRTDLSPAVSLGTRTCGYYSWQSYLSWISWIPWVPSFLHVHSSVCYLSK
jgi:hypothetical protein